MTTTNFKLCVLGDGGVGKTALTIQFCSSHFVETYDPTIEDSYTRQTVIDGIACRLEILDTAGQEEFTALRDQWIRDSEGFVLIYSIISRVSFEQVTTFLDQVKRVKCDLDVIPITLVGNKCDLEDKREVSSQEAQSFSKQENISFFEASAKTRHNVEDSFFSLVRKIRETRKPTEKKGGLCNLL
eukprot:TRINITY_DN1264_c0_g1_i1.p1 TRINITY_DN1264_c0_g1~~TRINITY_DN1264_c0_g1_i1.p1  ORF type:complete len:185 (-),score=64.08 TRINITY_DN1264_c0_g1_i1:82-636(-)